MIGRSTAAKSFLALVAITTFSSALYLDAAHAESTSQTRANYARISRGLAKLSQGLTSLSTQIANQKPVVAVTPGVSVTPAPAVIAAPQAPIGKNQPTSSYISFDFYDGRVGEAISYHNDRGIGIAFRVRDRGASSGAQEYKLDFPFAERTAEQRTADSFMIQTCMSHFHRVADAPNGGTFFINPNKDSKIGLLCSSQITK